ncbi:hypothetical protein ACHAXT_002413 [Thalassiosira profunda]
MCTTLARVFCALVLATATTAAPAEKHWKGWTCDQLTPDLCADLEVETGTLEIRNLPVKYWRYTRPGGPSTDEDDPLSIPIIALHGGPSWPHNYILPVKQLACRGAEVIFYDQAGCGESTLVKGESVSPEEYPHLLDPAYYSEEELPALIEHWGLDKYHLLGHSWGTMLAQLFALNAKDISGLQSLVLSGPLSDSQSYVRAQWDPREGNLGSLPPFVQERIHVLAENEAYDSEEYEAINDVLTSFFTSRIAPMPDCIAQSVEHANIDVYTGMQGPSEFAMSGVLEDFNVTGRLHEIDVPVLLTHGKFDTMRPTIVKTMERELKIAERVLMPHSGHVSMIDDAGLYNDAVADFLVEVSAESGGADRFVPIAMEEEMVDGAIASTGVLAGWIRLIVTFAAGLTIGRLCQGNGNGGYAQVH